jgi:hypothetical protein
LKSVFYFFYQANFVPASRRTSPRASKGDTLRLILIHHSWFIIHHSSITLPYVRWRTYRPIQIIHTLAVKAKNRTQVRKFMDKIVVEKQVLAPVESGGGTASNFIWAVAFIIIVGMIVGALYYSGFLRRVTNQTPQKINVEVSAPAPAPAPAAH